MQKQRARRLFRLLAFLIMALFLGCRMPEDVIQVVGGSLDTPTNDGIIVIDYPFTFDISSLGSDFSDSDITVVANGFKKSAGGLVEEPAIIRWSVSGTTLTLLVWDASGVEFKGTAPIPPAWLDRRVELSYIVTRYH